MEVQKISAQEIIQYIGNAEKKTTVKVTFEGQLTGQISKEIIKISNTLFGDWSLIQPLLADMTENKDYIVELDSRNSAVPLLDIRDVNGRIEPGAIIREHVVIGDHAVIMMGAIINIGAEIGAGTMIDMGEIGCFNRNQLENILNEIKDEYQIVGTPRGIIVGRGYEGENFQRIMEIQIPIALKH